MADNTKNSAIHNPNSNLSSTYHHDGLPAYQYVPTLRQSGFLIGEPVAYTSHPNLPTNYRQFTPRSKDAHVRNSQHLLSPPPQGANSRIATNLSPPRHYEQPGTIVHHVPLPPGTDPMHPSSTANFIYNSVPQRQTEEPMVARWQYDRCAAQCRTWQQKYNELYTKYIDVSAVNNRTISHSFYDNRSSVETDQLKRENSELRLRVRELERKQEEVVERMEDKISYLIRRARESTLKECMLLTDRYRLEKKTAERY